MRTIMMVMMIGGGLLWLSRLSDGLTPLRSNILVSNILIACVQTLYSMKP